MANGDIVKLGTLYLNGTKQARPTKPWRTDSDPGSFGSVGNIPGYSSGNIEIRDTDSADANKMQWVEVTVDGKKMLIGDRVCVVSVSWDTLNAQSLIFGKEITIDGQKYKVRSLTGGSNYRTGTDNYSGGQPTNNEWDRIIVNEGAFSGLPTPNSTDLDSTTNATDRDSTHNQKWNWAGVRTWCQETYTGSSSYRANRGYYSARCWNNNSSSNVHANYGFRPCLEVLNAAPLISDSDRNLGSFSAPPSPVPYTVSEADGENFSILEVLDSTTVRSLTNQSAGSFSFDISAHFAGLSLASHTMKVTATDPQGASSTRTWTFTKTNSAPGVPTINSLVNNMRLPASGYIEFTPTADPEGDTQTAKVQFATNSGFSAGLVEFSSGLQMYNGSSWASVTNIPSANVGKKHRIPYSGIALNATRYIRVVTADQYASANSATFTVSMGDTLEIKSIPEDRDLRPLTAFPIVESVIDAKATVEVYVSNNAKDAAPVWEDCTAEYLAGQTHTFTNATKTAANWAVAMRIVITANDATGIIEVSAIGMGVS